MKYYKHTRVIFSIAFSLLQSLAYAKDDFSTVELQGSDSNSAMFHDIPSVYSASKYEQKVTKAPASISIVTADEIKKYGYRTFGQILSSLRGFYSTTDRAYGYAGARGFGLPSDFNTRLLLMIDGHRYNDNITDAFDIAGLFPVDLDVIERVEVVRGPSSSLYGTNAVFGVINVITKRGRDQHGASIKASYGTNDTYQTSASYGKRFDNGLETFVTGTFYDSQGYNKLFYKEFDNPANNNGLSIGNDGEQSKKLMAKAAFGDFSLQALYVDRKKDIPTASFQTLFNSHAQNFTDQSTFVELKYDHTFENQLNILSRLSYNNNRFLGVGAFGLNTPTPSSFINNNLFYGEWWRAEFEASKLMWKDHHITVGGQYQDNYRQDLTNYDVFGTNLSSKVQTYQGALFAQDDYSITDKLSLNAGVRYDYYSIFGSTINPRVGLIYNPWQSTTFKLLYGQSFRAPNQFELNYSLPGSQLANPSLKPEKLDTLEFIIEHYFTRQLRTELNIFHTNINNIITSTTVTTPQGNLSQFQNGSSAESSGVEAQVENTWGNGFQGRLSYSWQDTTDAKTGARLTNSPEHMIKVNLIAPAWKNIVFVGFETQFMSSRKTPPKPANGNLGGSVGDNVISNLTVFTKNWVKGLELSAGAYNLFDVTYFDPASTNFTQNAIQQNGFQYRIKVSYDF
jgi:outer membrane receptor for ferrienterochelin and colicins